MRRTSLVCGGFLLVLGILALIEALRLRDDWMGALVEEASKDPAFIEQAQKVSNESASNGFGA